MKLGLGLGIGKGGGARRKQYYNWSAVISAIRKCGSQRVDFVGIGDSNQVLSGLGWDHGFQYALSKKYPMYATGVISQSEGQQNGSGIGYLCTRVGTPSSPFGAITGAPADLSKYLDASFSAFSTAYYSYIDDAGTIGNVANGLIVSQQCPLDVNANLRFRTHYGTFAEGSGSFRPGVRQESSPYTTIAQADVTYTVTGSYGMAYADVLVPAATRDYALGFKNRLLVDVEGPFFCTYLHCINDDRSSGFAYNTVGYYGGQSARSIAVNMQAASDDSFTHYYSIIRDRQGENKTVIVIINEGLNDRNETEASVGPLEVQDGDSAEAYADNLQAIINRINSIWTLNSWNQSELYFILMPSHPVSNPDASDLISYREAAKGVCLANPRTAALLIPEVINSDEMLANGYYASDGADTNHLTQDGYEGIAEDLVKYW